MSLVRFFTPDARCLSSRQSCPVEPSQLRVRPQFCLQSCKFADAGSLFVSTRVIGTGIYPPAHSLLKLGGTHTHPTNRTNQPSKPSQRNLTTAVCSNVRAQAHPPTPPNPSVPPIPISSCFVTDVFVRCSTLSFPSRQNTWRKFCIRNPVRPRLGGVLIRLSPLWWRE